MYGKADAHQNGTHYGDMIQRHLGYGTLILPVIVLVLTIMTAIVWNNAITAAINHAIHNKNTNTNEIWALFGYAIILSIILLVIVWIGHSVAMSKLREATC